MSGKVERKSKEEEVAGLDAGMESEMITLVTSDKKKFEIERKYAFVSELIKTAFTEKGETEVPTPSVNGETMKYIIGYMKLRRGEERKEINKPMESQDLSKEGATEEEVKFLDDCFIIKGKPMMQILYDITCAANYLDIPAFLDLCTCRIGSMMMNKSAEEVAKVIYSGTHLEGTEQTSISTSS